MRYSTELKGHQGGIEKIAFNPVKDAELCSVSNDGVVKFWDVRTKTCINEVKGLGAAITVVWAPDGESLIVGNSVRMVRAQIEMFLVPPHQIGSGWPREGNMLIIRVLCSLG